MYRYGSIVFVNDLLDRNGVNPKNRRCVVIASDATAGGTVDVVPIYGLRPGPIPADYVPLPWRFPPHPITGLIKPSGADCGDFLSVAISRTRDARAKVPPAKMLEIAAKLRDIQQRG